ncbi:MAG: AbaSI family restriction endonuclease [bacterium]
MLKKEYIIRQLSKTNKKNYENYVITGIIHNLNDLTIKFVTQQCVLNNENKRYLADLYFPQINLFIEVDERHHLNKENEDAMRARDFEMATNGITKRVLVSRKKNNGEEEYTIEEINQQIFDVVNLVNDLVKNKKDANEFIPWDINKEHNPKTWIRKGSIEIIDKVSFNRSVDACKCLGLNYKGFQHSGAKHPYERNTLIWFPKLYDNGTWLNSFDEENGIIKTSSLKNQKQHVDDRLNDVCKRRIVFAHVKDNLGQIMYRFKGVFEMIVDETNYQNGVVWKRVCNTAKTYDYE